MKEEEIITLEKYLNPMTAEIVRGRLEENGIHCFVASENDPYNTVLGVNLKIFASDKERCLAILAEDPELQ
ncbi:MAG TPA: DUF2007 domain-containing protein [Sphingobacteriaceae bacterium]|nr:DUF2007 domain-containing protein [Sphingobacteriaceae bacterium]